MKSFVVFFLLSFFYLNSSINANASTEEKLVFDAKNYTTDLKNKITTVTGDVQIRMGERKLKAKNIQVFGNEKILKSKDYFEYTHKNTTIQSAGGTLNFKAGTGNFVKAQISIGKSLHMEGSKIDRIDEKTYRIENGKISTCADCPAAWSVIGSLIFVEVGSYVRAHHAFIQIKDIPIFYVPYILFPIHTDRKSGLLTPYLKSSPLVGNQFSLPYFLALNSFSDLTLTPSYMSKTGSQIFSDLRIYDSQRSRGNYQGSITQNLINQNFPRIRYHMNAKQRLQLNKKTSLNILAEFASEPQYSLIFPEYFKNQAQAALKSKVNLNHSHELFSASIEAQLMQNNIARDFSQVPIAREEIHKIPELTLRSQKFLLNKNFSFETSLDLSSFQRWNFRNWTRVQKSYPLHSWIRSGERAYINANLSWNKIFLNSLRINTEIKNDAFAYHFTEKGSYANNSFLYSPQLSTEFEGKFSKTFHLSRDLQHNIYPFVQWSYRPEKIHDNHPFYSQCLLSGPFCISNAPKFDLFDHNSDAADRITLRSQVIERKLKHHHILTAGIKQNFIRKTVHAINEDDSYDEILYIQAEGDFDLLKKKSTELRFYAQGNWEHFSVNSEAAWNLDKKSLYSANRAAIKSKHLSLSGFQTTSLEEITYGAGFSLQKTSPVTLNGKFVFDGKTHKLTSQAYMINYLSKSECWNFSLGIRQNPNSNNKDFEYAPLLNVQFSPQKINKANL